MTQPSVDGGEAQDARIATAQEAFRICCENKGEHEGHDWNDCFREVVESVRADLLHEVGEAVKVAEDALGLMDAQAVGWRESGNLAQAASYESVARHMRSRLAALGLVEGPQL